MTNLAAPGTEYGRRLQRQSARMARLIRLHRLVVSLRRLFFGAVVILGVWSEKELLLPRIVIIGVPAFSLECIMFWRIRVSRERSRAASAAALQI